MEKTESKEDEYEDYDDDEFEDYDDDEFEDEDVSPKRGSVEGTSSGPTLRFPTTSARSNSQQHSNSSSASSKFSEPARNIPIRAEGFQVKASTPAEGAVLKLGPNPRRQKRLNELKRLGVRLQVESMKPTLSMPPIGRTQNHNFPIGSIGGEAPCVRTLCNHSA